MTTIRKYLTRPFNWFVKAPIQSSGITGVALAWIGLVSNVGGFQSTLCSQSWFRPVCSALHWSGVASRDEQELWNKASSSQTCDDYREYISKYGDGEFSSIATSRLVAARRAETINWQKEDKSLPILVAAPLQASANEAAAHDKAIKAGEDQAKNLLCRSYASGEFKLSGVEVKPASWDCKPFNGGTICGFSGDAICHVEAKIISVSEDCSVQNN